jgi:hypothetical protein
MLQTAHTKTKHKNRGTGGGGAAAFINQLISIISDRFI